MFKKIFLFSRSFDRFILYSCVVANPVQQRIQISKTPDGKFQVKGLLPGKISCLLSYWINQTFILILFQIINEPLFVYCRTTTCAITGR